MWLTQVASPTSAAQIVGAAGAGMSSQLFVIVGECIGAAIIGATLYFGFRFIASFF